MLRKTICMAAGVCCIGCIGVTSLAAQSAARLDDILAEDRLTYGSAAYLVLGATGRIDEAATRMEAVERLEALEAALTGKQVDDPLNLGELSLILIRVFEIEGGLLFRLLQDPRYAARELEFRGAIQGNAFPRMRVTGERGLRILNRVTALREEGRL